jgi:arginine/lysine/ornithine decarboxylase
MPGHKGNSAFLPPISLILQLDVTELPGSDNLHDPTECIAHTQAHIAKLYGADKSFFW